MNANDSDICMVLSKTTLLILIISEQTPFVSKCWIYFVLNIFVIILDLFFGCNPCMVLMILQRDRNFTMPYILSIGGLIIINK